MQRYQNFSVLWPFCPGYLSRDFSLVTPCSTDLYQVIIKFWQKTTLVGLKNRDLNSSYCNCKISSFISYIQPDDYLIISRNVYMWPFSRLLNIQLCLTEKYWFNSYCNTTGWNTSKLTAIRANKRKTWNKNKRKNINNRVKYYKGAKLVA